MTERFISSVNVRGLFGLYSYTLPEFGEFHACTIFYGQNGTGKTTILKLIFHLLSSANDRGHRSALFKTDFEGIDVFLSSGYKVSAVKKVAPLTYLQLEIRFGEDLLVAWDYYGPSNDKYVSEGMTFNIENGQIVLGGPKKKYASKVKIGNQEFLSLLSEITPATYLVDAERGILSDKVEQRRNVVTEKARREGDITLIKEAGLSDALRLAASWITRNGLIVANRGSMNVQAAYLNMLSHLADESENERSRDTSNDEIEQLISRLDKIRERSETHAKYELSSPVSIAEFNVALGKRKNRDIIAKLLKPYVQSLESRLDSTEDVFNVVNTFVTCVNDMFVDKIIKYTTSSGFCIFNKKGNLLTPSQLSSGEQHLLFLFCYLIITRDSPSVFVIDEPEISLNIKWQRRLVQSLIDVSSNSKTQLLFASHSFEILTQHMDSVVTLDGATHGNS